MGEFNPLGGQIFKNLSEFYMKYEVHEKAVFNAKKRLAISLNINGEHSIETALSYKMVGEAHHGNREYELGYKNLQAALNIMEELYS